MGYRPWGRKESDQLSDYHSLTQHLCIGLFYKVLTERGVFIHNAQPLPSGSFHSDREDKTGVLTRVSYTKVSQMDLGHYN